MEYKASWMHYWRRRVVQLCSCPIVGETMEQWIGKEQQILNLKISTCF